RTDRPSGKDEESREELQTAHERMGNELEQTRGRITEVQLRLGAHENSLREAGRHKAELEACRNDLEEWRRLNELLGSANGKKFRELAQSYTFRFLVENANIQLRQLSPRYELRTVPGTLTLEIIDRDMFDQHRYVSSLSGGETFVVSLALALGLATLSAGNLSIGSLFIDEGFGNLDHDSLELVMSALSGLENSQGRKVGVISHTEQIRSQISPQIRLVRLPAGGRSRIEVG
ncbi:MAG: ATP-dependent exonuclease, partial [Bacteroidaceae bacterium]|nr:ATP-dependent exonuclease [Bacteroidaceae bacterium]